MKFFVTSRLSENIHETPEGYLVCQGVSIARTGEMHYAAGETPLEAGPDGKVTIQRDAEEVFRPETIASFQAKPITIGHPPEFVEPENWNMLTKGVVQNVRRGVGEQENDLVADLLITDSRAITLVKNGLREVSCGYEAEYLQTGVGRGAQKSIIGNHLALVEEGRAGASYAINDHKRKGFTMKTWEKVKAIFGKAQDEAMRVIDDASCDEEKKDDEKEAKDAMGGYDELVKLVKDLGEKVAAMAPKKDEPKDASTQPTQNEPAKVEAGDDMETRMKKLEDAVGGLLKGKEAGDADVEKSEEMKDEEAEEMAEDDDLEGGAMMTGDEKSRVEILAPGFSPTSKDFKAKAIEACYQTQDGKAVIELFTLGAAPDLTNKGFVDSVFVAASELLKTKRSSQLSQARKSVGDTLRSSLAPEGAVTAEKLNEINAQYWAKKA